jgi:hypothetical protein
MAETYPKFGHDTTNDKLFFRGGANLTEGVRLLATGSDQRLLKRDLEPSTVFANID